MDKKTDIRQEALAQRTLPRAQNPSSMNCGFRRTQGTPAIPPPEVTS